MISFNICLRQRVELNFHFDLIHNIIIYTNVNKPPYILPVNISRLPTLHSLQATRIIINDAYVYVYIFICITLYTYSNTARVSKPNL